MSTRDERMRAIEAAVFRTITDADWQRHLVAVRLQRNRLVDRIRSKILVLKVESKPVGKIDHE